MCHGQKYHDRIRQGIPIEFSHGLAVDCHRNEDTAMRNPTAVFCLAIALLMGGTGLSWSADFQKGLEAAQRGDYVTALREWTPLAEQGDASAQYNLGVMYGNGQGVPQDYKAALEWYTLAAEQGMQARGLI